MIFVTVGNATQGFRRLLDAIDRLAGEGLFGDDDVFIQSGYNHDFHAVNCKQESFMPMDEFVHKMQQAAVIVCHAGTGTLSHALRAGKVPVVMPRRMKYGEIVDDHQLELVQTLNADDRVIPVYEPDELPAAVAEARRRGSMPVSPSSSDMHRLVAKAIEELIGN